MKEHVPCRERTGTQWPIPPILSLFSLARHSQGRAQSSFLYISLSPVLEQSPGALGTHRRMPHLAWDLQGMVRNETKGRRAADPGYSVNLAGYAKTFKLEPLGNWGPSDSFAKGRDTKVGYPLQREGTKVEVGSCPGAESASLRGWKKEMERKHTGG